jgi:hypothetical protein
MIVELKATRANVICRIIRQVKQGGIELPAQARARLPLLRVLHCGPGVKDYSPGDVALFLVDPTTVDPRGDFVYGEFTWKGEVLLEMPASCLGARVEGFEVTEDFAEGISEADAAEAMKGSKLVVPQVRH